MVRGDCKVAAHRTSPLQSEVQQCLAAITGQLAVGGAQASNAHAPGQCLIAKSAGRSGSAAVADDCTATASARLVQLPSKHQAAPVNARAGA
jgi:hypothetical protein